MCSQVPRGVKYNSSVKHQGTTKVVKLVRFLLKSLICLTDADGLINKLAFSLSVGHHGATRILRYVRFFSKSLTCPADRSNGCTRAAPHTSVKHQGTTRVLGHTRFLSKSLTCLTDASPRSRKPPRSLLARGADIHRGDFQAQGADNR